MNRYDKERLRQAFACFGRNFRWGTCVDCPVAVGNVFPEFCCNTHRYDHHWTLAELTEQYEQAQKDATKDEAR